jgi:hypothetical protein
VDAQPRLEHERVRDHRVVLGKRGQIVLPPPRTGIRLPYDSHRSQGGLVRKMRMFLIPLTLAAIVAMMIRRTGKHNGSEAKK